MIWIKGSLITTFVFAVFGGHNLSVFQESYAYNNRRVRPMNSRQVYPRWLNPVLVDGFLYPANQMPAAPTHRTGNSPPSYLLPNPQYVTNVKSQLSYGDTWGSNTVDPTIGITGAAVTRPEPYALSLAADSRGVAHIAGVNYAGPAGSPGNPGIYYYNNRFDTRRANGFSAPLLITTQFSFMSAPSIAVSPVNDGVSIAYITANNSLAYRYLNPTSGMWEAEIVVAGADGNTTYAMPSAKYSSSGTLNIVCRQELSTNTSLIRFQIGGGSAGVPGSTVNGWIIDFRFTMFNDQASVVWQYRTPDAGIDLNNDNQPDVWERRGGLLASLLGQNAVSIGTATTLRDRAYEEVPDIAHEPDGSAHLVWVQARVPAAQPPDTRILPMVPPVMYYQRYGQSASALYSEAAGNLPAFVYSNEMEQIFMLPRHIGPRIICDALDRVHVFTGEGVRRDGIDWSGRSIRQSVRVPNGIGGFMWVQLAPIAFDVVTAYYPQSMNEVEFGTDIGDQLEVVKDINDQFHITDASQYTRTMDPELGIRDPNAMVGVLRGTSVNVTNGNLNIELPLFAANGAGLNQELSLIYNSREFGSGLLSQGWKLNYEMYLIDHWRSVNSPGSTVWRHTDVLTLVLPDGRYVNFRYTQFPGNTAGSYHVCGNNFDTTGSLIAKLERTDPAVLSPTRLAMWATEYDMTLRNGTVYRFNSQGKLRLITDPGGNTIELFYNAVGLLESVTDKDSRTTTLEYESGYSNANRMPRVNRIVDPMNREYELIYGVGPQQIEPLRHLSEVRFAGHSSVPTWSFEYGAMTAQYDRLYFMKRIRTPLGTAGNFYWSCRYSPDGRILAVTDPPDPARGLNPNTDDPQSPSEVQTRFYYNDLLTLNALPEYDPNYESVVTNKRGKRTRYISDPRRSLVYEIWNDDYLSGWNPTTLINDPTMPAGFSALKFIYDYESLLMERVDRWGIRHTYSYDPSTQNGHQHVIDRVKTIRRWQGAASPLLVSDHVYTNDGLHQVYTKTGPVVTAGTWPGVQGPRTIMYTYYQMNTGNGRRGQIQSITYPDCASPDGQMSNPTPSVVQYQYQGPFGSLSMVTDEESRSTVYSEFNTVHGLPGSKVSPGCTQAERFEYNAMGYQTRHRLPQGGNGNSTPDWSDTEYDGLYRVESVILPPVTAAENDQSTSINANRTTVHAYDVDSNLTSVTPPAGTALSTTYNRFGQVTGGSGSDGTWSQTVDANGNVRTVTDVRGYTTTRIYDVLDRLIESRIPASSTVGSAIGGGPEMVTVWIHDGFANNMHFSEVITGGPSLSYQSQGASPRRVMHTNYDGYGRPSVVMGPDAFTSSTSYYDEIDQVYAVEQFGPEIQSGGGTVSAFQRTIYTFRDERGRVLASQVAGTAVNVTYSADDCTTTLTWHDRSGFVTRTRDNGGSIRIYVPDSAGRVRYVRDAYNVNVEERLYGDDGLLIETRVPDPVGKTTTLVTARTRTYTSRKELWTDRNAASYGLTYQYGRLPGQVEKVTNAEGVATKSTYYSGDQRVDEVIQAFGTGSERKTKHTWTHGLMTALTLYNPATAAFNATISKDYDCAGRIERIQEPLLASRTLGYNCFGELKRDVQGTKDTTHVPDGRGLPTQSTYANAAGTIMVSREFNGSGLATSLRNGMRTLLYSYDDTEFGATGNLAWSGDRRVETFQLQDGVNWRTQSHRPDANGNPRDMADSEVAVVTNMQEPNHTQLYDLNGRPTDTLFQNVLVRRIAYTPGGLTDTETAYDSSGAVLSITTHTYDSLGRRRRSVTMNGTSTRSDIEWSLDAMDRVESTTYHHMSLVLNYEYNDFGELEREWTLGNGSTQPSVGYRDTRYEYDPRGNREVMLVKTSPTDSGTTTNYTYNSASQLYQVIVGGITTTHEYDDFGNLESKVTVESGQSDIVEGFTYDYMNRQDSYSNSATGASWEYEHWPNGDRLLRRNLVTGDIYYYVQRRGDVASEYQFVAYTQQTIFINRYIQGVGIDGKYTRITASGDRVHYVGYQVGTLAMTLDDSGEVLEECVKDAWGINLAGNTNDERYGYAQREHDMESGLVYMRHRMYDPRIGRFTQIDPVMDIRPQEHYRYAANNPVSLNDPMGTDPYDFLRLLSMLSRIDHFPTIPITNPSHWLEAPSGDWFQTKDDFIQAYTGKPSQRELELSVTELRRKDTLLEEFIPGSREMADQVYALAYDLSSQGESDTSVYAKSLSFGAAKVSGAEGVQQFVDGRDYGRSLLLDHDVRLTWPERATAGGLGAFQFFAPAARGVQWSRARSGIIVQLKRPPGFTDAQWQAKLDVMNETATANGAWITRNPGRSGETQRAFRIREDLPAGIDADHGLDLWAGGTDTMDNMTGTPAGINRSVGGQGRWIIRKNPDGTRIRRFETKPNEP